jgi:hypothetical protein
MNSQIITIGCAIGVLGTVAAVTDVQAQKMSCQTATFSEEVLTRFPRAREGCLEITERNGEPYALYKAEVTRVRSDGVDVRFKLPEGGKSDRRYIKTRPEFRVLIDGRATRVRDLAVGQELTAYVKVREPVVALAQPADEPVAEPVPLEAVEPAVETRVAEAMPQTASALPLFALLGSGLVLLAGGIRRLRRRS